MEQVIRKLSNFNSYHSIEYLSQHVEEESVIKLIDNMLTFAENYMPKNIYMQDYLIIMSAIVALITNNKEALEHKCMPNAYHVDTQERENTWRIQIYLDFPLGITSILREMPKEVRTGFTVYLREKGMNPYFTIFNSGLNITATLDKK